MPTKGDVKDKTWNGYNKDIPVSQEANKRRYLRYKSKPENKVALMLNGARQNAKRAGVEFTLKREDLIVPDTCPVLGIPLYWSDKRTYNTPSIDRIYCSKGYTSDNIVIVSWRANLLKKDATLTELQMITEYYTNIEA